MNWFDHTAQFEWQTTHIRNTWNNYEMFDVIRFVDSFRRSARLKTMCDFYVFFFFCRYKMHTQCAQCSMMCFVFFPLHCENRSKKSKKKKNHQIRIDSGFSFVRRRITVQVCVLFRHNVDIWFNTCTFNEMTSLVTTMGKCECGKKRKNAQFTFAFWKNTHSAKVNIISLALYMKKKKKI